MGWLGFGAGFQRLGLGPAFACLALFCSSAGCSSDIRPSKSTEGLEDLQPVAGSVSFNGQPTPGAVVLFIPAIESGESVPRIAGIVDEEGAFEMSTTVSAGTLPGVQPGKYVVTISWNKKINPDDKDSDDGPDLVPSKYGDPATSQLQVEVEVGDNKLEPFELKE
jgi:hypothetical protein